MWFFRSLRSQDRALQWRLSACQSVDSRRSSGFESQWQSKGCCRFNR
jgi:hypothetical protein